MRVTCLRNVQVCSIHEKPTIQCESRESVCISSGGFINGGVTVFQFMYSSWCQISHNMFEDIHLRFLSNTCLSFIGSHVHFVLLRSRQLAYLSLFFIFTGYECVNATGIYDWLKYFSSLSSLLPSKSVNIHAHVLTTDLSEFSQKKGSDITHPTSCHIYNIFGPYLSMTKMPLFSLRHVNVHLDIHPPPDFFDPS